MCCSAPGAKLQLCTTHCSTPTTKVWSWATSRLYITFVPGTTFQPVTTPYCPFASSTCIPNLICPTGRKPFSFVRKGCFWLVWMTSLVVLLCLPCASVFVVVDPDVQDGFEFHAVRLGIVGPDFFTDM